MGGMPPGMQPGGQPPAGAGPRPEQDRDAAAERGRRLGRAHRPGRATRRRRARSQQGASTLFWIVSSGHRHRRRRARLRDRAPALETRDGAATIRRRRPQGQGPRRSTTATAGRPRRGDGSACRSFEQLVEERPRSPSRSPRTPRWSRRRERRAKAIAAVDPALVEAHRRAHRERRDADRVQGDDRRPRSIRRSALLDLAHDRAQQRRSPSRARSRSPTRCATTSRECTPQALLRDLHRAETLLRQDLRDRRHGRRAAARHRRRGRRRDGDELEAAAARTVAALARRRALIAELRRGPPALRGQLLPRPPEPAGDRVSEANARTAERRTESRRWIA